MSRKYRADCGVPCRSSTAGLDDSPAVMKDNCVPPDSRSCCRFGARISAALLDRLVVCNVRSEADAFGEPLAFALELLAPRQLGTRRLLRATDGGRLHLAIAHIGRSDDAVGRDGAVRHREGVRLAALVKQSLALAQQHRERERADLVDEVRGEQRMYKFGAALCDERWTVFLF